MFTNPKDVALSRRIRFFLLLWLFSASAAAADATKIPAVGDWLEYRLAFPRDPLESTIRRSLETRKIDIDALPPAEAPPSGDPEAFREIGELDEDPAAPPSGNLFSPRFQPERRWNAMPLRIEVREVRPDGLDVILTLPGYAHDAFIPLAGPPLPGVSDSDAGAAPSRPHRQPGLAHMLGKREYPVAMEWVDDPDKGFARLVSPELPFGLARFASPHCDLVLVEMGGFPAPPFPIPDPRIEPPPGKLFPP